MENLPAWFEEHPVTKKIKADHEAEHIKGREEIVREIERLRDEAREIPCTDDAVEEIREEIRKKEGELLELKAKAEKRVAETRRRRLNIETHISRLQGELLESASPRLDTEIEYFEAIFEKLRSPAKIHSQSYQGERDLFNETQEVITASNLAAIEEALKYCRVAVDEIGRMKFQAEPDEARLKELRENVPNWEERRELVGVKVMPGLKGTNPLHRFPSDSELDWRMGKLLEKAKKLLRK